LVQLTEKEKEGRDGWGRGLVVVKVYVMGMMVESWKGGVLCFGFSTFGSRAKEGWRRKFSFRSFTSHGIPTQSG